MSILIKCICVLFLLSGLVTAASAKEENRQSGVETSAEHKSDQGLEHGEAYAGSKEKKAQEEADDEEEDEEAVSGNGDDEEEDKTKGKKAK